MNFALLAKTDWSALATVVATLVALAVAGRDAWERHRERRSRRALAAIALFQWVQVTKHRCGKLADDLSKPSALLPPPQTLKEMAQCIQMTAMRNSDRIIEQASWLDDTCACAIARADSVLGSIEELGLLIMQDVSANLRPNPVSMHLAIENCKDYVKEVEVVLTFAEGLLASDVPKKLSHKGKKLEMR